jgi:hypothetical protein
MWRRSVDALCELCLAAGDDAVQHALLGLAGRLFAASAVTAALFTAVAILAVFPLMVSRTAVGWVFVSAFTVAATLALAVGLARRRAATDHLHSPEEPYTYSPLERVLHVLALQPKAVPSVSFALERSLFVRRARSMLDQRPVFVSGLARSGTTVLFRALYSSGEFASSSYRDMPFVLAPNAWGRISGIGRHDIRQRPRIHDDGIVVDADSPESFEQVFWANVGDGVPDFGILDDFEAFMALVVSAAVYRVHGPRERRYMSKNNANLSRLRLIAEVHSARVVIPFREPVATALSLHRQHLRMSKLQSEDAFFRCYMRWLGHHEFGLDHRPVEGALPHMVGRYALSDPNYWLEYWIGVHRHVLTAAPADAVLAAHDRFVADPVGHLTALSVMLGMRSHDGMATEYLSAPRGGTDVDVHCACLRADAIREANALYATLLEDARTLRVG